MADVKDPQVKTIEEYHETTPRRWPILIVYIIVAVIIALLIVFGARAIYHHYHKSKTKTETSNTTAERPGSSSNAISVESGSGSSTNSGSGSTNSSTSSNSSSNSSSSNLPNNGPGQVVSIFIGTSLAAAGLHYVMSTQRSKAGYRLPHRR